MPVDEYLRGIALEIAALTPITPLETVYLGGGTPSKLGPDGISRLLEIIRSKFTVAGGAEVTIEANPEDISAESIAAWSAAGVNRLSIGIQSFDDAVLAWMHRVHTAGDAARAIDVARNGGITNFSVDLIFALPSELNRSWERDLDQALALEPPHISLYGLTIEPSTPLARWQSRGSLNAADEDLYAGDFLLADSKGSALGYQHYEVSNFALPGMESRHNSAYWTGAAYLGLGPSAHSFDGEARQWNVRAYAEWIRRLDAGVPVTESRELLTESNRAAERVYLGLRTTRGLTPGSSDLETAKRWLAPGWASIDDGVVRLTPEGWLRLDSLAAGLTGF